jgi:hypothetical protein
VFWYILYGAFLTFNRQILAWFAFRYNQLRGIDDLEMLALLEDTKADDEEVEEEETQFWKYYKYIIMPYIILFRFTIPDVSPNSSYVSFWTTHTHSLSHSVSLSVCVCVCVSLSLFIGLPLSG